MAPAAAAWRTNQLFRPAILLIVLAGSLAATITLASAYEPNKVYRYNFEGAITNKVADDDKPQYSGVAIKSNVLVSRTDTHELTVRLEQPQIATFNDVIEEIHLYKHNYQPLAGDHSLGLDRAFNIYSEPLAWPSEEQFGSMYGFDSYKDESKWVTNFKRGLLSFFQLKLEEDRSPADGSSASSSSSSSSSGGSSSSASSSPSGSAKRSANSNHEYYTRAEMSVFGECDTEYLVITDSSDPSLQKSVNVTKTRNMARCKSRFLHRFMPIDSSECYDSEKSLQEYKHSNAIFQYELLGSRYKYLIKQVLLDEVFSYAPFGQRAHSHSVHSKFMLKLAPPSEQPSSSEKPPARSEDLSPTKLVSLSYDPPEMVNFYAYIDLDREHHLSSIYQSSATVEQVIAAFDALVQEHRAYTGAFEHSTGGDQQQANGSRFQESSRLAELFIRLNELVGTLNSVKIEQLYAQVDERGEAHKKIFWDSMSCAGTNPSFVFMKRLITDGDAPSVKIKDFLTRLSYHIKMPSKSLFDEYVNLCKSDKIQTNQQYKRLCSLPLASLIHQHCAKPHAKFLRAQQDGSNGAATHKKAQNTCQIATAEEYFARLVSTWPMANGAQWSGQSSSGSGGSPNSAGGGNGGNGGSASVAGASSGSGSSATPSPLGSSPVGGSGGDELSLGDKMFNIKMAGELGVKPSIDFLMDVVANRDEHPTLRSAAMWQLRKVSLIYPKEVKRLVVPYYYDRSELLELRLAALYNWLQGGLMTLHEMETLAKQLQSEPSRQLVIYVHSLLASYSNVQALPCMRMQESQIRQVMPAIRKALARHAPGSLSDSHAALTGTWQPEFGYGTMNLMSVIFSNESMAPSNLFYSSSEIMSGLRLTPMSISIQAHGLDKLIKRVVGINGLLADKESFMDVFSLKRRSKRQVAADLIKQEANEIEKELKLGVREFSDVYLAVTISAYGRPITFFDRDSRELKKMLSEDGTIKIPQIKKLLHSFNNHTTQQMMVSFEKLEMFNNELGLPLYQSINDFDYKTFKLNSIKLDVEPGFFRDERQGRPPTKMSAALDAKLGRHNEMFVATGALIPSNKLQVGVGFYKKKLVNVPLRVSLEANLTANQITIKRQPIHESLLYIKQTPVTFVKSYDPATATATGGSSSSSSSNRSLEEWRPLYDFSNTNHEMKPFKLEYMTPLALGVRLEGKHRAGQDWSMAAWRRHLSSVGMAAAKFMYFYSPTGAPIEARLSTVTTEENPTREMTSILSWRHHHHDDYYSQDQTPQQLNEVERDLEASLTSSSQGASASGPPTIVSYKLSLAGGSTRERKVSLDISYARSFSRLLHKWRAFYQRTPLDQAAPNSEVTNLCWLGSMSFPNQSAQKLLAFDIFDLDHSANMTSELTFGDECSVASLQAGGQDKTAPRVSARLHFDWSQEQREAIESALGKTPSQGPVAQSNQYAQLYKRCLSKRESSGGAQLDATCLKLLRKMGELTHLKAYFDYKDVPERWTKLMRRLGSLYTYARAGYIDEMDDRPQQGHDYKSPDGQRERAHLEANMTSAGSGGHSRPQLKLSYEFDTPTYHVVYRNLPISVPALSTFALAGSSSSYYQQVQQHAGSLTCMVSGSTLTTFDNYTFTMPPVGDGCFKLLAKDCSPERNFIILGAKIGQGKVVKVYLAQKFKVEFVPDKDGKRISDIKVNGETVQVEEGRPALRRDTKMGPRSVEAFTIDYNGVYYTLDSKLYKFSLSTDGRWISVLMSKYYAGKSCGLCGDANGDQLLEFKSPVSAKRICQNPYDFTWSHVVPSTCASRPDGPGPNGCGSRDESQ